jgi:hypothetical protein
MNTSEHRLLQVEVLADLPVLWANCSVWTCLPSWIGISRSPPTGKFCNATPANRNTRTRNRMPASTPRVDSAASTTGNCQILPTLQFFPRLEGEPELQLGNSG